MFEGRRRKRVHALSIGGGRGLNVARYLRRDGLRMLDESCIDVQLWRLVRPAVVEGHGWVVAWVHHHAAVKADRPGTGVYVAGREGSSRKRT